MSAAANSASFRKYHRWLGFFLAGIMGVYAISGTLLIFRKTDFLKFDQVSQFELATNMNAAQLAQAELPVRELKVTSENEQVIQYAEGQYDKRTGIATVIRKDYPLVLNKLVKLHKATHGSPLFFLNVAFGVGLLFFVISAFLMFLPKSKIFKSNLKIAGVGLAFALLVVIFGSQ